MSETESEVNHEAAACNNGRMGVVSRAMRDGAADAREAAARTWDTTSLFMRRFVYTTCYTCSYGVVFPSMLIARAIPKDNAAVRGLIEGAQAAKAKVNELHDSAAESSEPVAALAPA
jgi:hypothetical protein